MITIDADAAVLAGLQIDLLRKYRTGSLSPVHLERFLNLSPEAREQRFGDGKKPKPASEPIEKFELLVDLGIITVPEDYVHGTRLGSFHVTHQGGEKKSFYFYHDASSDVNYSNPSRILKPGDKLWVRAHKQVVPGTTTSQERMAFLEMLKSYHTGAQGASLVFDQKRSQLPKGYWYASFDKPERLWRDAGGDLRVPGVIVSDDGDFNFSLGFFEEPWDDSDAFLSFCDVTSAT